MTANPLPVAELEAQLNDFDPEVRRRALDALLAQQPAAPAPASVANMHCHTFFSFNAYGHSPTSLAWLGRQRGFALMGTVDFDVLDGVDEFLDACDRTGVRGSTGIETRVFLPEFAADEMNSPGEPGVLYHMGIGFATGRVNAQAAAILDELRGQSRLRNLDVLARVNAYLDPVVIDYERDVLPLTPLGNATERHMVVAYVQAAARLYRAPARRVQFWANRLAMAEAKVAALMADMPAFQNTVRSRLMKRGGVGYVQPGHDTFPPLDKLLAMITACGALPCAAWLDGTTRGEQRMDELLDLLVRKGSVALNLVPDRNWDIADPAAKAVKLRKLYAVVELARAFDLPLNIGTEMNSYGQKLVDDFAAPELAPVRQDFLDGAYFAYGHTRLQRRLGLGYSSRWAQDQMAGRPERNRFYTEVGRLVPPGPAGDAKLAAVRPEMTPAELLAYLRTE
jgi:hypothetical protein